MDNSYNGQRRYRRYRKKRQPQRDSLKRLVNYVPGISLPDSTEVELELSGTKLFTDWGANGFALPGNNLYAPFSFDRAVGYDKWMSVYTQYYVRASSIEVTITNTTPFTTAGTVKAYCTPLDMVYIFNPTEASANAFTKSVALGSSTTKECNKSIHHYFTTDKIFGKDTSKDIKYSGNNISYVQAPWYWNVAACYISPADFVNNPLVMHLSYKVKYYVKFYRLSLVQ